MKITFFRLLLPALLVAGFTIALTSCEQNDIENITQEASIENTQLDFKAPKILANVTSGSCCTSSGPMVSIYPNKRDVEITLDLGTYNYYCANGNSLTYKFYRYNNPTAAPIVKTSNSFAPTFCLPATDLALLICNGGGCGLSYSGGGFSTIPNTGVSSSPVYNITPNTCRRSPVEG